MRRWLLAMVPLAATAQALAAATVSPCDDLARADGLREPWEANTATYAEGAVRIAVLDLIEPAGAPMHLLVISPPLDEVGARQCRVISAGPGTTGFFDIDLGGRRSSYDPAKGLALSVPVQTYDPATGGGQALILRIGIDQSSGRITADTLR